MKITQFFSHETNKQINKNVQGEQSKPKARRNIKINETNYKVIEKNQ